MRRRYDTFIPFEERILKALGDREMYGLELAAALGMERSSNGFATLYRALHRLSDPERLGVLTTRMEPARIAERDRRPRRRLYRRARPTPPPAGETLGGECG